MRVCSLVPSLTEAIAETRGGRAALVGVTDWCTHPGDLTAERVGGTKNPAVARIIDLAPDVVIASFEENRAPDLAALREAGLRVHLTDIRTLADAWTQLPACLDACGLAADPPWLRNAEAAWRDLEARAWEPLRAAVMIWRRPWMAVGSDTFTGDVLRAVGVQNVLAHHPERYPTIDPADVGPVDCFILPDEPYAFTATDGPESCTAPSRLVSGRLLTWYGPSLVAAARELPHALRGAPLPA